MNQLSIFIHLPGVIWRGERNEQSSYLMVCVDRRKRVIDVSFYRDLVSAAGEQSLAALIYCI